MKSYVKILIAVLAVMIAVFLGVKWYYNNEVSEERIASGKLTAEPEPVFLYGIRVDTFNVEDKTVLKNEFLSTIFQQYGVGSVIVNNLVESSKDIFNPRNIKVGQPYTAILTRDSIPELKYLIYHSSLVDYVIYNLADSLSVTAGQKEVETVVKQVGGTIQSSLYEALVQGGASANLAMKMADMFAWTIDFYSIQQGDWFKVVYEQQIVEGEPLQVGNVLSAVFHHKGKPYHAYRFQEDDNKQFGYYNEKGEGLKRFFLKAPLKFSTITSRYSLRRFHPVQKTWKAHLGTDYAAPHGTPIIATANGTVTASTYNSNNGHFVKIKHNNTYTTQYLHMSKRAVKVGQRVNQGQVIGYVGSTGLATGPHVCYRFWKNGQQVDPLRQVFPSAEPLSKSSMPVFEEYRNYQDSILNTIQITTTTEVN